MGQNSYNVGDEEEAVATKRAEEMRIYDSLPPRLRRAVGEAPYMYALWQVVEAQEEMALTDAELYRMFQDTVRRDLGDALVRMGVV